MWKGAVGNLEAETDEHHRCACEEKCRILVPALTRDAISAMLVVPRQILLSDSAGPRLYDRCGAIDEGECRRAETQTRMSRE
jgi:hypothetical protein